MHRECEGRHTHRGYMKVDTLTQEVWKWTGSVKVESHTERIYGGRHTHTGGMKWAGTVKVDTHTHTEDIWRWTHSHMRYGKDRECEG